MNTLTVGARVQVSGKSIDKDYRERTGKLVGFSQKGYALVLLDGNFDGRPAMLHPEFIHDIKPEAQS
jgi:hypothetical protein